MTRQISHGGVLLAIIIPAEYDAPGINFFTPNEFSQQLAQMRRPAGYVIPSHFHNPVPRAVEYTKEALFIRKGRVRVDLYDDHQTYVESHVLKTGDVVLLTGGGHGFEMLEETDMVEVKQGPYPGESDKTRFPPVAPADIVLRS